MDPRGDYVDRRDDYVHLPPAPACPSCAPFVCKRSPVLTQGKKPMHQKLGVNETLYH